MYVINEDYRKIKGDLSPMNIVPLAIIAAALAVFSSPEAVADEKISYTAKENENGKFCAKVEVQNLAGGTSRRMKCRTLEQWKAKGYEISTPVETQEVVESEERVA